MNNHDKKHIELVDYKIDELKQDIQELKEKMLHCNQSTQTAMNDAHLKTDESLSFIKENLFNPNEGLWAETKKNTTYREDSQKWRGVIGTGFIGLFIKQIYDLFT